MMKNKTNPPEIYLPATSKNYTYYPIQTKKQPQPPSERGQQTIRVDWHRDRRDKQIDTLRRANEEMRERQEIYIDKLMKLEEGLENQHRQFVKLQELYTELFQSYKKKELQIAELQFKYRESGRYNHFSVDNRQTEKQSERETNQHKKVIVQQEKEREEGLRQLEWVKRQKDWLLRETHLMELNESLSEKLLKMNEKYEKILQDMSNSRARQKNQPKTVSNDKLIEEIQQWQRKAEMQKQCRLKHQYQNEFLKNRIQDQENQRTQLEQLLTYKQKEIGKLREEKIHIHRQTSEKMINRSHSSSSRVIEKTPTRGKEPEKESIEPLKQSKTIFNQSVGSQTSSKLQQYFSFSRQKRAASMEGLPNFPPELEIDSLINEHRQ